MSLKKPEFPLHLTSESMSKGTNTVSSSHKSRIGRSTVVLAFLGALAVGHTLLNHSPFAGGLQPNVEQTPVLGQVVWGQCEGYHVPGADCGYITVPTDYHNASVGYTKIALGRYKATASPRRGMVLYNPGGPGGPGRWMVINRGPFLHSFIGNTFDIIGFDPRGIGETEPRVNCFGSDEPYHLFKRNTVLERGYDIGPNLTDPRTREHLLRQHSEARSMIKTQLQVCAETMGDTLGYMGTTTAARDVDYLTTHLEGKDALINFYGMSYGSVMGQYVASMFPNRIGRLAIDGIVDAGSWANLPAWVNQYKFISSVRNADKMFLRACSEAGPSGCALAANNETAKEIEQRIDDFLADLYFQPLSAPRATPPRIITSGTARLIIFGSLHAPRSWATTAKALSLAMQGDGTMLANLVQPDFTRDLERLSVTCNDQPEFKGPSTEEIVDISLRSLRNVTRFGMCSMITEADQGCEFWPIKAKERFTGPWNQTLSNPILIVSNTADPATPVSAGRVVERMLGESARLLMVDSPGHTSKSLASLCYAKASREYFAHGELPPVGTVCSVDESAFPDPDAASIKAYTAEELEIIEDLKRVGDFVSM